jgi:alginate O-acetyltransferase complex protein AlgI
MVFASLVFLFLFLPLNLCLYFLTKNQAYRNGILILFSLFFYAWGEPVWIIVLLFSASVDFINAFYVQQYRGRWMSKAFVALSLIVNLGLLFSFKYSGFIYENLNAWFGLGLKVPSFSLPIGISFYTFQAISYVVDVYRGEVKAQTSYAKFLLFISLYHQLVAGPIVRYVHIANEIDNRVFNATDASRGIIRFCIGLFKKVYFANAAGELVAAFLDVDPATMTVGGSWLGLLMFTLQIYFDFSGYSDMAIGLGWIFGFHYHENFNYPYTAKSATEFWRRWHISLGSFFRDYVYIPMGGNRRNAAFNLLVVWFLTGLWHGASWNFILWGLYFGFLIWIERAFVLQLLSKIPVFVSHVYLLFAAVMGWAIFYFTDLSRLGSFMSILFGATTNDMWGFQVTDAITGHLWWLILAGLCCMPTYGRVVVWAQKRISTDAIFWSQAVLAFLLFVVSVAMLVGKSFNPFLYFRF